jgi:hypothetical protein
MKEQPNPVLIKEISALLRRCPDLDKFSLKKPFTDNADYQISMGKVFAPLDHLSVRNPQNIRRLKTQGMNIYLEDIRAHFPNFRSLQELTILSDYSPSAASHFAAVCGLMNEEEIHLRKFATDCLYPPEVFRYLTSYSGIEHLALKAGRYNQDNSPALMDYFFSSVLPLHQSSIKVLKLGSLVETVWTGILLRSQLDYIESCKGLTKLACWACITPIGSTVQNDRVLVRIFFITAHYHLLNGVTETVAWSCDTTSRAF